jgi:hypothetical protein
MAFIELVVKQALAKIINCYCKECVGDIDIPTAPKLISFDDTKLMNPNGCMCFDCIKELYPDLNYKSCARSYEYKDISTSEFTCWCNGCFGHINGYDCKVEEFKLDVVYKTIKISRRYINDQFTSGLQKLKDSYIFTVHTSISDKYYSISSDSEVWKAIRGGDVDIIDIVDELSHDMLKIGRGRVVYYESWSDFAKESKIIAWAEYSTSHHRFRPYRIPYEIAYDEEFIKKVLYYGEYRGYRHNKYVISGPLLPVLVFDEIPWGDMTFMMLIDYFRSAKVEDLDQRGIDCYHKVKAQYCFECNKYIGACLGHEIPDRDEYKYIVNRPNLEKRIEYLEQQIKALKSIGSI